MKKIRIILSAVIFIFSLNLSAEEIQKESFSGWACIGTGIFFASDNVHEYVEDNAKEDAVFLYQSISFKLATDMNLFRHFNLFFFGGISTSLNYAGSYNEKFFLNQFSFGFLPGYVLYAPGAVFIFSAGPLYQLIRFKGYAAVDAGYNVKVSFEPKLDIDFTNTRGFILFDFSYADDNNFTLGGWGIQIGAEFLIF